MNAHRTAHERASIRFRAATTLAASLLLFASCGDDSPTEPGDPDGTTIDASGGAVTSDDGVLTLTVPPGAVSEAVSITVERIASDFPGGLDASEVVAAYRFGPDGATFAEPVAIEIDLPGVAARVGTEITIPTMAGWNVSGDEWEAIEGTFLDYDADTEETVWRGEVTHFSAVVVQLGRFDVGVDLQPATQVGSSLPVISFLRAHPGSDVEGWSGFADFLDKTPVGEPVVYNPGPIRMYVAEAPTELYPHYQCERAGGTDWQCAILVAATGPFDPRIALPSWCTQRIIKRVTCTTSGGATTIPVNYPAEGMWRAGVAARGLRATGLCESAGPLGCILAATDFGTWVVDLDAGLPTLRPHEYSAYYGCINLVPPDGVGPDALEHVYAFGPFGGARTPLLPNGTFGATQLGPLNENTTDALPYDGLSDSGGFVITNNQRNQIESLQYDANGALVGGGIVHSSVLSGFSGNAVSAMARSVGARAQGGGYDVLIAMDGAPGELVRSTLGGTTATSVAPLGNGPRRLRAAGDIAVVSNFDSDDLTVLRWTPGGTVEAVTTVDVGDGPIGIDLLPLSGGETAVISTGYFDDTYTVTVLDSGGNVVSNSTMPVPEGGSSPGHAIWIDTGTEIRAVLSCNGTSNLHVVDVSF
jgi:hypothetical protein